VAAARPAIGLLAFLVATAPLAASDKALEKALDAFGRHAGYISATVLPCGGNEDEVAWFAEMVEGMVRKAGATDEDIGAVTRSMEQGRAEAKPIARDCTDEGGQELALALMQLLDEVRSGLERRRA